MERRLLILSLSLVILASGCIDSLGGTTYKESTEISFEPVPQEFEKTSTDNSPSGINQIKNKEADFETESEGLHIAATIYEKNPGAERIPLYNELVKEGDKLDISTGEAAIGYIGDNDEEANWECIWIHENARVAISPITKYTNGSRVLKGADEETVRSLCKSSPQILNR